MSTRWHYNTFPLNLSHHTACRVCNRVEAWLSGLCSFVLDANTCGDVMVNALHRDGGVGNWVALQVTHKALDATVNLQTHTHTHTTRHNQNLFHNQNLVQGRSEKMAIGWGWLVIFGGDTQFRVTS